MLCHPVHAPQPVAPAPIISRGRGGSREPLYRGSNRCHTKHLPPRLRQPSRPRWPRRRWTSPSPARVNRAAVHHRFERRHQGPRSLNNGGGSTRFRANGSSELADGSTVAIQFEYEEGNADGTSGGQGIKMRHANIQYRGDFGAVTVGQGSEAADGSQFSDTTGVNGIGHGAGSSSSEKEDGGFSLGKLLRLSRRRRAHQHDPLRQLRPSARSRPRCRLGTVTVFPVDPEAEHRRGRHRVRSAARCASGGRRPIVHRSLLRCHLGERPHHLRCLGKGHGRGRREDRGNGVHDDPWRYTVNPLTGNFNIRRGRRQPRTSQQYWEGFRRRSQGTPAAGVDGI